jgi:hypothetical protein
VRAAMCAALLDVLDVYLDDTLQSFSTEPMSCPPVSP